MISFRRYTIWEWHFFIKIYFSSSLENWLWKFSKLISNFLKIVLGTYKIMKSVSWDSDRSDCRIASTHFIAFPMVRVWPCALVSFLPQTFIINIIDSRRLSSSVREWKFENDDLICADNIPKTRSKTHPTISCLHFTTVNDLHAQCLVCWVCNATISPAKKLILDF